MAFFVHLPSNSSQSYYPSNRYSSFRTHLPTKLSLTTENYEVALTEISYIHCIAQLPEASDREIVLRVKSENNNIAHELTNSMQQTSEFISFSLTQTHYGDILQLLKSIRATVGSKLLIAILFPIIEIKIVSF